MISNTQRRKQQYAVGLCFYSASIVSFDLKTIALLNHLQGDMGLQGPGGIPPDNGYVEKPTPGYELLPEQYKVKGLRQDGRVPIGTDRRRRKRCGFLWSYSVTFKVEMPSPPN